MTNDQDCWMYEDFDVECGDDAALALAEFDVKADYEGGVADAILGYGMGDYIDKIDDPRLSELVEEFESAFARLEGRLAFLHEDRGVDPL